MSDDSPSTAPTASARSTTRGGAAKPRPRAGIQRKTKAEREQFAKAEAERQKARAAEVNRGARGGRATTRGGRGSSAAGHREEPVAGGGVFGAGSSARLPTKSRTSYEGYGELVEGSLRRVEDAHQAASASGRATTAGHNGSGQAVTLAAGKAGIPRTAAALDTTTDEEPDDENKRDIERIMISSDDDDDEDIVTTSSRKGKQKATSSTKRMPTRGLALRPVRAPRTLKEEEGQEGDAGRLRSKRARTAAGHSKDAEPQEIDSKSEPEEDTEDAGDSESLQFIKEQPSSPEMRKRTLKKQLGASAGKTTGRDVNKGPVTETVEERAERMRAMEDTQKLRRLFVPAPATDVKMKVDEDEDKSEEEEDTTSELKDGKLFLFQLPPLTPFLVDSTTAMHTNGAAVKTEPGTTGNSTTTIDLEASDERTAGAANTTDPEIKADPDAPAKATAKPGLQMDGLLTASEPKRLPAGVVGKLRVHKSGKVTLDWGGTDMEVRYGSEVNFLQDVVLVEPGRRKQEDPAQEEDENGGASGGGGDDDDDDRAEKEKQEKDIKGTAYAMGPVRRKMVLIPDWVKLYD
ncbi:uncharacterized protein Z520_02889 [Fonsecaea multimorphosa CBS 102226]|uniref:DNA-directed RNA polymerase III subunit RPC4 n=1 Tax=Fonsecaea multimorphosa CBS 102226 TaxID=1442371 RepID=A0A0D2IWF3_9EURO|nr:uncharacterized protein Z520_02889 [Fonsecaea multimorphosa CBS 102226]KIY01337.1 hypothetical protein Z520_02889 [Fonsecaea multimorphosa CBS 102226]OAL28613.1 hypothetical protein AYO22_02807 [Fonsecaea multimorphosa]